MKKMKLPALFVCVALLCGLLLQGCSPDKMVVGKVGDDSITVKEVNLFINYILMQYSTTRSQITDAATVKSLNENALNALIDYKLAVQKAEEKGMYPLSAANQKKVEDTVTQYASSVTSYGITEADFRQLLTWQEAYSLVMADATKSVTVSDDEIKAEFDKQVAAQKASYDADASAYETAKSDGTTVIVYKPAGYRYVKHILIAMPTDIATQISTAQSSGDAATVKTLREQGLPKIQSKAEGVLTQVKGGGDFDALMAQYGEDPGMKSDQAASKTGYELGSATSFVQEFKDAALALAKVGDITGLVASDFGYHIIKYVGDVPSGPVQMSDVKDALKASVLKTKQDASWNSTMDQWKKEIKIENHPEKIPVVVPSATATTK